MKRIATLWLLSMFLVGAFLVGLHGVYWELEVRIDALEAEVSTLEDKEETLSRRFATMVKWRADHFRIHHEDHDKDPECLDGKKIQLDCAPKQRVENKGNRNHCIEVAEGPVGASDELMDKVGYEADTHLRKHVAWLRHGLGTRVKDKKRVVRYYNVTSQVAQASCQFLTCIKWSEDAGRTCKVMKGKQCDY